jgi:hypothetical protein
MLVRSLSFACTHWEYADILFIFGIVTELVPSLHRGIAGQMHDVSGTGVTGKYSVRPTYKNTQNFHGDRYLKTQVWRTSSDDGFYIYGIKECDIFSTKSHQSCWPYIFAEVGGTAAAQELHFL